MKNIIAYYYSFHPSNIYYHDDNYFFSYLDENYVLSLFKRPVSDASILYDLNKKMLEKNILMHEIIINNENNIITYVNNKPYIMMKMYMNKEAKVTLLDICHINNNSLDIEINKSIVRNNWPDLWESKNDYMEMQINEIGKKYPVLSLYINYYIGLAENAIMYVKNALLGEEDAYLSVCHKRVSSKDTLYSLYNPINLVFDYRVRDSAEYIKSSFFNNKDVKEILYEYFKYNNLSYKEALIFYARLLYPTYFFDIEDNVVDGNIKEEKIEKIISMQNEYEKFLFDVHIFLTNLYNRYFPKVDWIIKRS